MNKFIMISLLTVVACPLVPTGLDTPLATCIKLITIIFFKTKPRKAYYLSFQVVTTVLQTDGTISSTDRCYYVGMKVKKYGRPYFDKV